MKKWMIVLLACMLAAAFGGTVYAFDDLDQTEGKASILELKRLGIVSGIDDTHFNPRGEVSFAQGVHLIVRGLGLNIDNIRFFKEPKASDFFSKVPDDAWYAGSFIIAQLNGLPIAKDVDPDAVMSREQYTDLLIEAMLTTGEYAFNKMLVVYADQRDADPNFSYSIQLLLLSKIASLDADKRFLPKQAITRAEAAVWLQHTRKFVEAHKAPSPEQEQVTMKVDKVNDDINKVTLSWGKKPNAGYSMRIVSIQFGLDGTAEVGYVLTRPSADGMYEQVITEPTAIAYLPAAAKPVPVMKLDADAGSTP